MYPEPQYEQPTFVLDKDELRQFKKWTLNPEANPEMHMPDTSRKGLSFGLSDDDEPPRRIERAKPRAGPAKSVQRTR